VFFSVVASLFVGAVDCLERLRPTLGFHFQSVIRGYRGSDADCYMNHTQTEKIFITPGSKTNLIMLSTFSVVHECSRIFNPFAARPKKNI